MSYSIIRNANYKKDNLAGLYKHNERKNTNYSNKDIDFSSNEAAEIRREFYGYLKGVHNTYFNIRIIICKYF